MADTGSEVYRQTRYHPEYDGRQGGYPTAYSIYDSLPYASRIVHSVDRFTGSGSRRQSIGGRSTVRAGAAINNAFSFLNTEDYNAYKYYSDVDDPVSMHTGTLTNGYTNGYTNGHGPYSFPKSGDSPNSKDHSQLKIIKIAIVILLISLAIVIAVGTTMYFVFRNNNSSEAPVKQEIYRFKAVVQFNTSYTNAHDDETSAQYLTFTKMLRDGIDQVFASGAFSSIYNSTEMLTLSRSANGFVKAELYIVFKDPEEKFVKSSLVELVQGEVTEELATHVTETIITISVTDPDVPVVTTPAGVPDPTTPAGTGFTTAAPTTLPTVEVDCVTLTEPLCTSYYSKTGPISSSASDNFKNLHKAQAWNCYAHTTAFVCSAIYPECRSRKLIKPCRIFCESFKAACNVPINCEAFPDDDLASTCVLAPGYMAPQPPSPPSNPCTGEQFRCGTDPPTCVASMKKCDGTADCADGSDETSKRADCDNVLDSSLQCDFAAGTTCQYSQFDDDDFDWLVVKPPTLSADTGPYYDHTSLGTNGYILLAEASGQQSGAKARLASHLVIVPAIQCLHFYYHMTGADVGSLKVLVVLSSGRENVLWFRSSDQTNLWKKSQLSLPIGTTRIILEAERGPGFEGDISIDDISVTSGECTRTGCEDGEFECTNKNCQPPTVVCNGRTECGDFSDEMGCTCTASQFKCAMGMCVKDYERCDGTSQCPDDSDEINCSQLCSNGQHKCDNGNCIQQEWICDGNNDCGDSSDETNCPSCASGMFKCADSTCVAVSKRCDGTKDCSTNTDEQNCYEKETDNTLTITKGAVTGLLCAENLPDTTFVNNELCRQVGLGLYVSRGTITKASMKYYKVKTGGVLDGSQSFLTDFETSATCSGNNVLTITCMQKTCGQSMMATNQIVNGNDALAGRWPWMAALFRKGTDGGSSFICGATIITTQHVMTAAHCISGLQNSPGLFEVLVGSLDNTNRASPAQLRQVLVVYIPPEFSVYYLGSDLAILELDRKLVLGNYVQPVCLPESQEVFGPASISYSAGWGKTETGQPSNVLKEAKQQLWDFATCNATYTFNINTKSVCAGYASGFITNCQGDSGGPLMSRGPDDRWRIIGTYSFGQTQTDGTCKSPEKPSVFTRIQDFLSWIESQTQCAFDCGNGECLYNNALKCDGVIDCSNRQDETAASCNPTIDCDFSDTYRCGYLDISGLELRQGMATITGNRGPITDHTQGTPSGYYLYGIGPLSAIMAPVYNKNSAHCLGFYSQMRGEASARLRVYVTQTFDSNAPWTLDLQSLQDADLKYDKTGTEYTGWLRHVVDIPAGEHLIVFVTSTTGETETGIGIDDVTLTPGECSTLVCPAEHVACEALGDPHKTCIPNTPRRCNYVEDCPLSATDEGSCTPTDLHDYVCTLDKYGECSIRQHHEDEQVPDSHDFRLVVANPSTINQPPYDANTPTASGGYMLVMDTRLQANGELAIISIKLGANRLNTGCFKFKYWMESEGSLRVHIDHLTEPWRATNTRSTAWIGVEISIDAHEETVSLTAAIGASPATTSFIAVDDFSFSEGNCPNPSCSDGKITCDNGKCIDPIKFCDGVSDCSNNEDEPDGCDCMPGFFQCQYTRGCKPVSQKCDGVPQCRDLSDELDCTCSGSQFKCDIGLCIDSSNRCNNARDCPSSWSDEKGCSTCPDGSFSCTEGGCYPAVERCNGVEYCSDGSDESGCTECKSYEYKCADGSKCVPNDVKCDGWVDCDDNSDEANCVCQADHKFYCNSTGETCMPASSRCNNVTECETEVDEGGCGSNTELCAGNPASCDCGYVGQATNQIVGGTISDPNTWPWSCALYFDGGFICGCVMINERWVITAAHCFFDAPGTARTHVSDYRVRVDTTKSIITDGGTVYRMEKYRIYAGYQYGILVPGDMAMVKLKSAVAFSSSIKPVCMPEPSQEFTQNSLCFVIGWGYTGSSTDTPRDLREAQIRVLPTAQCASAWPAANGNIGYNIDTNMQLCAIYETALIHTCGGDSGSPMMCKDAFTNRWQLAGVTSGGNAFCDRTTQDPRFPAVFTKMSSFVTWIDGVIDTN